MQARFGALIVAALLAAPGARAEDLNEKFGKDWTCESIAPGLALHAACKQANCDFSREHFWRDSSSSGHCVDVGKLDSEPRTDAYSKADKKRQDETDAYWKSLPDPTKSFSALASGKICNAADCRVSVGSVIGDHVSIEAASAKAIAECSKNGIAGCNVVLSWSGPGCGYIAPASQSVDVPGGIQDTVTSFTSTVSAADAMSQCRAAGFQCDPAIGGCGD